MERSPKQQTEEVLTKAYVNLILKAKSRYRYIS